MSKIFLFLTWEKTRIPAVSGAGNPVDPWKRLNVRDTARSAIPHPPHFIFASEVEFRVLNQIHISRAVTGMSLPDTIR